MTSGSWSSLLAACLVTALVLWFFTDFPQKERQLPKPAAAFALQPLSHGATLAWHRSF